VIQEARKNLSTLSLVAAGVGVAMIPASMTRVNAEGGLPQADRRGRAESAAAPGLPDRQHQRGSALMREEALKLSAGRKRR
jgi:hypothetical protein